MAKKQKVSYQDIEQSLKVFKKGRVSPKEVGYNLLLAFGKSEADIRRYREGKGVLSTFDDLLIKGFFCFCATDTTNLTMKLESLKCDVQVRKAAPMIIAVSDGETLLAYDTREQDTYENPLNRVYCDFAFFYPLAGVERFHDTEESPADVKAAEKLAKLHDEIRAYNEFSTDSDLHDLNIFIARLLFCFFAEDTSIFENNLFTSSIERYTKEDGSDLSDYLDSVFNIMDVRVRDIDTIKIISQFPYVNGGLFAKHIRIPMLGRRARKLIVECGELDWKDINPDIFGSMIQAVVNPDERANQGMHYTSVPNIMKVINPLFLDGLRAEYNKLQAQYEEKKRMLDLGAISNERFYAECKPVHKACEKLLIRMSNMKFFDPACGSGNFLIITYKALRMLEMDIWRLQTKIIPTLEFYDQSMISIDQFYGIELLDFPHEVAMLSLWLAEHQMNRKLHSDFGVNTSALPLKNITHIVCGNACRIDWNSVCPHTAEEEVFVFGNPPYVGTKWQNEEQKHDVDFVMADNPLRRTLDYISCWFVKGANYIEDTHARLAFVSTNSVCQGEQVAALWSYLFYKAIEINFCYHSFKWGNNAKHNAGVTCIIIGLTSKPSNKYIYSDSQQHRANNINPYLLDAPSVIVAHSSTPISDLPQMIKGSQPTDGGALLLNEDEKNEVLTKYPALSDVIRQYMGADDLINGSTRYCLWLIDATPEVLYNPEIQKRLELVRRNRLSSTKAMTRRQASTPHLFTEIRQPNCDYFIVPVVSSERREYIPIGFNTKEIVANTNSLMIPTNDCSVFGIISSRMHFVWMKTVCGRLELRYAYSATVVYNTFPFPKISNSKRKEIEAAAEDVLMVRAGHPEKTLAELYNPDTMPTDLRNAHLKLDEIVDSCYMGYPFVNDEARLETLFKLYEKMTLK